MQAGDPLPLRAAGNFRTSLSAPPDPPLPQARRPFEGGRALPLLPSFSLSAAPESLLPVRRFHRFPPFSAALPASCRVSRLLRTFVVVPSPELFFYCRIFRSDVPAAVLRFFSPSVRHPGSRVPAVVCRFLSFSAALPVFCRASVLSVPGRLPPVSSPGISAAVPASFSVVRHPAAFLRRSGVPFSGRAASPAVFSSFAPSPGYRTESPEVRTRNRRNPRGIRARSGVFGGDGFSGTGSSEKYLKKTVSSDSGFFPLRKR